MNQREFISIIEKFTGHKNILAIPRILVEITPNISSAFLLSQLIFWSGKTKREDGFFYKTAKEFSEELGVSEATVKRAKDRLEDLKIIETKLYPANGAPTTHYKINFDTIFELIKKREAFGQSDQLVKTVEAFGQSDQMHLVKVTNSITDITTENTQDSLSTSVDKVSPHVETLFPEKYKKYEEHFYRLNKLWKQLIGRGSHKSPQSKILISGKYGGAERKTVEVWAPFLGAILRDGADAIAESITNYSKIINEKDTYLWQANLTLGEFLQTRKYEEFLDQSNPLETKKLNKSDPWNEIRQEFQPLTSNYTAIFNEKEKRYYGFKLERINSEIRQEDVENYINNDRHEWTFDNFIELEYMIAGMLFRRKNEDNLVKCEKYMAKWKDLIPRFKKEAKKWLKEEWELYK